MSLAKGVLEEVIRRAMDDGIVLKNKDELTQFEEGMLFAYVHLIDWAQQQSEVWNVKFNDKDLQAFDPYTLFRHQKNDSNQDSNDQTN